jgi:hypothetical protein
MAELLPGLAGNFMCPIRELIRRNTQCGFPPRIAVRFRTLGLFRQSPLGLFRQFSRPSSLMDPLGVDDRRPRRGDLPTAPAKLAAKMTWAV